MGVHAQKVVCIRQGHVEGGRVIRCGSFRAQFAGVFYEVKNVLRWYRLQKLRYQRVHQKRRE